ncbi:hypothetical protein LB559_09335 [Mesorhizobium sp. BR1-1-3]|uniref:hypothetical protein n=1 Tax=Mesorhizobium sp. BR1-1-3 TaxID=2876651 RepID=UPI001CD08C85|nr:hypothetical protein [Mesorhizobium sp. BR1-1-3]MBZ9888141.1 hypothetical protein [Mesorhizobium sp. BR1-1-3]
MAKIAKGTILSFCGGEWSDRWTSGPYNVLQDFDQKEVVDRCRSEFVKAYEWHEPSEDGFAAWLELNLYIEDVPESYSWYVGSYGDFTPTIADEKP